MNRKERQALIKKLDKLWALRIKERDKVCQYHKEFPGNCGKVLQAAHIFSRRNMNTRWDLQNGLLLCQGIHIFWAHTQPTRFNEWIEKRLGHVDYKHLKVRSETLVRNQDLKLVEIYLNVQD